MSKSKGGLLVVVLLLAAAAALISQEDPKRKLMSIKSGYSHRLLDAIVQEDFETIRDQAVRLKAIAETADWKILDTPEYVRQSDAFIQALDHQREAARDENGDAAALAYLDVILKCVHCHRHMRTHWK